MNDWRSFVHQKPARERWFLMDHSRELLVAQWLHCSLLKNFKKYRNWISLFTSCQERMKCLCNKTLQWKPLWCDIVSTWKWKEIWRQCDSSTTVSFIVPSVFNSLIVLTSRSLHYLMVLHLHNNLLTDLPIDTIHFSQVSVKFPRHNFLFPGCVHRGGPGPVWQQTVSWSTC